MASRILRRFGAPLVLLLVVPAFGFGATINVSTSTPSNWLITGAGATNATALGYSGLISVTSNGQNSGTVISGGSLASFNGFWLATDTFFLPTGATNVAFTFSGFAADDRAVMALNGTMIANTAINGGAGAGAMCFSASTPCAAYTFGPITSGTITTGFNVGANNTLTLYVNNTGTGNVADANLRNLLNSDATAVGLNGVVSYDMPSGVPEPGSLSLILLGLVPTAFGLMKKRRAR